MWLQRPNFTLLLNKHRRTNFIVSLFSVVLLRNLGLRNATYRLRCGVLEGVALSKIALGLCNGTKSLSVLFQL